MSSPANNDHSQYTSGNNDSVWVHKDPYSARPRFRKLLKDVSCDVCIVGAGMAGISTAYELVKQGREVVLLEAREVLSGETGRTSGHLTFDLDDGYTAIKGKHGQEGAQIAADSHRWAVGRVEEIVKELGIECELRRLPAYELSQFPRKDDQHAKEVQQLQDEAEMARGLGLEVEYKAGLAVRGWGGNIDQRDGVVFANQATFHPTQYLGGVLTWLQKQPNFHCYTHTRVMSLEEEGGERAVLGVVGPKGQTTGVKVQTERGQTVQGKFAVLATCVPLQKLAVVAEMVYHRSYCVALRVPKGSVEDCLVYDQADAYKYMRLTACDDKDDYLVVGGCDHEVGQEETTGRFEELETWARERFPQAGAVDYKWSGQIFEPVDYMAFIGKNQGCENTYIVTGDSGDGLTHAVVAGKLIADDIHGVDNPWAKLYNPSRLASVVKSMGAAVSHGVKINLQYKRFLQSDIKDIEDLVPGSGGVLNPPLGKPVAVYKDERGKAHQFSALCPHMQGVVCWNATEKSFDCPVHASRFSKEGLCIMGPAKANLTPV